MHRLSLTACVATTLAVFATPLSAQDACDAACTAECDAPVACLTAEPAMPVSLGGLDPRLVALQDDRPFLGVLIDPQSQPLRIIGLVDGGSAGPAGLKEGDLLLRLGGTEIVGLPGLQEVLASKNIGDEVKVDYRRDGNDATLQLTLGARPTDLEAATELPEPIRARRLGSAPATEAIQTPIESPEVVEVEVVPAEQTPREETPDAPVAVEVAPLETTPDVDSPAGRGWLGVQVEEQENGSVQVTGVTEGSPADRAGLQANDVLTGVGGAETPSFDALASAMGDLSVGTRTVVQFERNGVTHQTRVILAENPNPPPSWDEPIAAEDPIIESPVVLDTEVVEPPPPPVRVPALPLLPARTSDATSESRDAEASRRELEVLRRENEELKSLVRRYQEKLKAIKDALGEGGGEPEALPSHAPTAMTTEVITEPELVSFTEADVAADDVPFPAVQTTDVICAGCSDECADCSAEATVSLSTQDHVTLLLDTDLDGFVDSRALPAPTDFTAAVQDVDVWVRNGQDGENAPKTMILYGAEDDDRFVTTLGGLDSEGQVLFIPSLATEDAITLFAPQATDDKAEKKALRAKRKAEKKAKRDAGKQRAKNQRASKRGDDSPSGSLTISLRIHCDDDGACSVTVEEVERGGGGPLN